MNVLLVSATPFEVAPLMVYLNQHFQQDEAGVFHRNGLSVRLLLTGVGSVATAWQLGRLLALHTPDWALNAGVAGAFDRSLSLGDVVQVSTERFGDLGVEEATGQFTDLFQLGLLEPSEPPFINGQLHNPASTLGRFLPAVHGLTVNRVHGHQPSIDSIQRRYPDAQVESMEGAAFFYACLLANIPFLEIRGISNYVESRNRAAWQLGPAIEHLNQVLIEILGSLQQE